MHAIAAVIDQCPHPTTESGDWVAKTIKMAAMGGIKKNIL
jgi:hypothetical protein